MSLNASVGPWNSSSDHRFGPSCTSGAIAGCPNPAPYASRHSRCSVANGTLSPTNGCITRAATSAYGRPRMARRSACDRLGQASGTNRPPSSASPERSTPAKSRAGACPRVEM